MSKPLPAELNGQVDPARSRRTVIGFGLIAFAVLITYGNTLKSEFIHDDTAEILQNPFVRDLSHIREIFTSAAWTFGGVGPYQLSSNYYRPIQYLTYAVLYRFFGPDPWGYHLYKLLSHLTVCGLVFWILWRWWHDYRVALCSSLLFAVHPANTEAVSWVSGITDTTCALFFLLSLLVYLQDRSHPSSNLRLLLLSFLFLVGMLSKETMVTFLAVILVYEWLETGRFPRLKDQMRVGLPLLAAFALYLALRINAIGAFTNPRQVQFQFDFLNWFQILLNQLILLSKYLALFFFPVRLNAHHLYDPVTSPFSYRFGFAFLVLMASLLGIRLLLKSLKPEHRGLLLVGSIWFPVVLLPVIVFFKQLGENVFTERYIYLPSIGLCTGVCLILTLTKGWRLKTSSVAFGTLLTVLASMSIQRNRVWQNELNFYETTAKASPDWGILNNLGAAYNKRGLPQDAIKAFEASIAIRPSPHALKNLGYTYAVVGRTEDSEATYRKAIALDPMDAGAYAALADALSVRGQYSEAILNYERALALYPDSTVALFSYAKACLADHRYDEAIRALQRILALSPAESARAYDELARVYQAQNLPELAAEVKRKASAGVTVQLFR